MKTKTINVTQKDIDKGERHEYQYCPIALACKRTFKTERVEIEEENMAIDCFRYDLPRVARDFIQRFDKGKEVVPFSFEITI